MIWETIQEYRHELYIVALIALSISNALLWWVIIKGKIIRRVS